MSSQQSPNVSNLVGQAGNIQSGIQQNLSGAQGAPDITQLIRNVGQMGTTQANIMGTGMAPSRFNAIQPPGNVAAFMGQPPNMQGGGDPTTRRGK